jgi:hypothetical protein
MKVAIVLRPPGAPALRSAGPPLFRARECKGPQDEPPFRVSMDALQLSDRTARNMHIRLRHFALLAAIACLTTGAAHAQAPTKPAAALSEQELREVLVWNSPWEGWSVTPGQLYSYRTTFRERRDTLLAEMVGYATNQRADSVVTIQDGRLTWQDANGADVSVSLADAGDLVGTASSRDANLAIVLRPRR